MAALKTQGTELWTVATATTSAKIGRLTSVNPPSPNSDELETTDLDSTAKEFVQGLRDYGEAQIGIFFDPAASSNHQQLITDFQSGVTREWLIGLSDGVTAVPAVVASSFGSPATTRSWIKFTGFIKSTPIQMATNGLATATLTVRCSGTPVFTWKA